jgi:two-component system, sensor histidine kinase and response regulator
MQFVMETEIAGRVLDRGVAMARVGGDAELLTELAVLFLEEYPRTLGALHSAMERGDLKGVERAAHGLKGSVANFGARPAVEAALQLEQLGRDQKLSEVSQALCSLELALAALRGELSAL